MKRKINTLYFIITLIPILLAGIICLLGSSGRSIYMQTKGSPSENVQNLLDAVLAGDGEACMQYTDSYQGFEFDADGETDVVTTLCNALRQSYLCQLTPVDTDDTHSLTSQNQVEFSYLDLNRLGEAVSIIYEDYLFDAATESEATVTTEEGEYLPEIYEQAYQNAVNDLLQTPDAYRTTTELQVNSFYTEKPGNWITKIDAKFAGAILGGISDTVLSDTLSVPNSIQTFVSNSIDILKGGSGQSHTVYTLPYSSTVGPKPDETKYFRYSPDQADQVLNIITYAKSCGLLEDQDVIFNPDAAFYPEDIICYCDETILIICWKEYINNCVCNCMEIKVAHPSQIKRKLTGDSYNSGILDTMSNMYAATNAVAAMSGDFYSFRPFGTTVYQGQLYRDEPSCEVLMIDDQGQFIFYYPDGRSSQELQAFIDENHIQFSLAFGPVLIENYTPKYYQFGYVYGLGQMAEQYTRAAWGEYDHLHYLFMTSGYAVGAQPPADLDAFINILLTKNLKNVYNLDGGQTAEIVILNTPYNQIDYRAERQMSDMVFFATAIPENTDE